MPPLPADVVAAVAAQLRRTRRALFITGAGISADSGVPTYRGIGGLYDAATTDTGMAIEEILSGATLRRDPALCWQYIAQVENAARGAQPNAAHRALARFEQRLPHVCVLTQNVDGLHHAAGSRNVIAIHGDVHELRCTRCAHHERVADYAGLVLPPRCPHCAAIVRPDVTLFGEMLPAAAVAHLEAELSAGFDFVASIGTSSLFPYIVEPVVHAARNGVATLEINPGDTDVSEVVRWRLRAGAAAALSAIDAAFAAG